MPLPLPPIDVWAPLNHKQAMSGTTGLQPWEQDLAPGWVGEHRRRLTAYTILESYRRNSARYMLRGLEDEEIRSRREYGDAALLVKAVRAAVLGEDFALQIDGADGDDPQPPAEPGPDADPDERAAYAEQLAAHHAEMAERAFVLDRLAWLDRWADRVRFRAKVLETEGNAQCLGDGVYLAAWSGRKRQVVLRLFNAGFYFPELEDFEADPDDFPRRVHLAWEQQMANEHGELVPYVRRITFELAPLRPVEGVDPATGEATLSDPPHARWDPRQYAYVRTLPWQNDDGEWATATETCYMSDGLWPLDRLEGRTVDRFPTGDGSGVRWQVSGDGVMLDRFDLGVDFLPIAHLPNTPSEEEHYGESTLLAVAQILDDLQQVDTDTAAAGRTTAQPVIAVGGTSPNGETEPIKYRPGMAWFVGQGGNLGMLDTSKSLDALLKWCEALLERLSVNSRTPAEVLGRMRVSEAPSGFAILLGFGPFRSLVDELRLPRAEKYPLLLRMVQRLAMHAGREMIDAGVPVDQLPPGVLEPGRVAPARLEFGSFLPADLSGLSTLVRELVAAHLLSRSTAVRILQAAGLDVESIADELEQIESEDFEGAAALGDATRSDELALDYLHRTRPEGDVPAGAPPGGEGEPPE